jgi:hypothetical protein
LGNELDWTRTHARAELRNFRALSRQQEHLLPLPYSSTTLRLEEHGRTDRQMGELEITGFLDFFDHPVF